jgi:hypothetical protein
MLRSDCSGSLLHSAGLLSELITAFGGVENPGKIDVVQKVKLIH